MNMVNIIKKLRTDTRMSQEQFAELFGVSRQSVQRWESGAALPELEKLIKISKYFDISLDALVLDGTTRITEELNFNKALKPKYSNMHAWECYPSNLLTEYQQSVEEGFDLSTYVDLFTTVSKLPRNKREIGRYSV